MVPIKAGCPSRRMASSGVRNIWAGHQSISLPAAEAIIGLMTGRPFAVPLRNSEPRPVLVVVSTAAASINTPKPWPVGPTVFPAWSGGGAEAALIRISCGGVFILAAANNKTSTGFKRGFGMMRPLLTVGLFKSDSASAAATCAGSLAFGLSGGVAASSLKSPNDAIWVWVSFEPGGNFDFGVADASSLRSAMAASSVAAGAV